MKIRQVWIALVVVMVLGMSGATLTNAQDETVLLDVDFEDGVIPASVNISAGWQIVDTTIEGEGDVRVLQGTTNQSAELLSLPDAVNWNNFAVELQVKLSGSEGIFLNTRLDLDIDNCLTGFIVSLSVPADNVDLQAYGIDCTSTTLDSGDASLLPLDEWMTLRMETIGSNVSLYVDDELVLMGKGRTPPSGLVALFLFDPMSIEINYIRATEIDSAEVADSTASGVGRITLSNYDGRPADVVAELQELGLVPEGGTQVFTEPYAFFAGRGNWFTPLAGRASNINIVMGGEMNFRVSTDAQLETCSLMSRLQTSGGNTTAVLNVQLVNEGSILVTDQTGIGEPNIDFNELALDFSQPHYLLIVAIDDTLNVFVDGVLVIDEMPVQSRSGSYGIGLIGRNSQARCEGTRIWVYGFD